MKTINIIQFFILLIAFTACKKEKFEIGTPFSKVKGISSTWELKEVWQTDEIAETAPLNVTDLMVGTTPSIITFTENGRTYNLQTGTSFQFIPDSGTWKFDDDEYPTQVTLNSSGNDYELALQKPVREIADNTLEYKYIRPIGNCTVLEGGKKGAVGYIYKYVRK
ncbi:MAG: DUF5004 domain-containing protein [Saprospiraceae bacterium]|jgi:hypothetical protein|nr:DUF5004 domain-containing protein [Saprospiraceae bacterium]